MVLHAQSTHTFIIPSQCCQGGPEVKVSCLPWPSFLKLLPLCSEDFSDTGEEALLGHLFPAVHLAPTLECGILIDPTHLHAHSTFSCCLLLLLNFSSASARLSGMHYRLGLCQLLLGTCPAGFPAALTPTAFFLLDGHHWQEDQSSPHPCTAHE